MYRLLRGKISSNIGLTRIGPRRKRKKEKQDINTLKPRCCSWFLLCSICWSVDTCFLDAHPKLIILTLKSYYTENVSITLLCWKSKQISNQHQLHQLIVYNLEFVTLKLKKAEKDEHYGNEQIPNQIQWSA